MGILIMMIRILAPMFMVIFLIWVIFNAKGSGFHPIRAVRLKIGALSFVTGFVVLWALLGDRYSEHMWIKCINGLMFVGLFAFRLVSIVAASMRQGRIEDSEEPFV